MNAGLVLRIVKKEFGFVIFLRHCVVRLNSDCSVGLPVGCDPETQHEVIAHVHHSNRQNGCDERALK